MIRCLARPPLGATRFKRNVVRYSPFVDSLAYQFSKGYVTISRFLDDFAVGIDVSWRFSVVLMLEPSEKIIRNPFGKTALAVLRKSLSPKAIQ